MDLPLEIETQILGYLHPYYLDTYSRTCKAAYNLCMSLIPELATTYCNTNTSPNGTIQLSSTEIAKLSFSNVIELSLIYFPIPESSQYYDSLHLLYNACKQNQPYIMNYLQNKSIHITAYYILWKYKRCREMIELFHNNKITSHVGFNILKSLIRLYPQEFKEFKRELLPKLALEFTYPDFMTHYDRLLLYTSLPHSLTDTYVEENSLPYLTDEQVLEFNSLIHPGVNITVDSNRVRKAIQPSNELAYINAMPKANRGVHYITSGYYLEYVLWKQQGNKFNYGPILESQKHTYTYLIAADRDGKIEVSKTSKDRKSWFRYVTLSHSELGVPAFHPDTEKVLLSNGNNEYVCEYVWKILPNDCFL